MEIPLGPFTLRKPAARGGMAVVWHAVHREQATPVAIKIMDGEYAGRRDFVRRFREEVRAVAGLDHPGIVMVLDHGELPAQTAAAHSKLVPGSPWLAMEYCSAGTLNDLREPLPWKGLKTVLLAILEGLSHAHARGVIHRDLKPANVLVSGAGDARPGLKLSDFGIAWAGDPDLEDSQGDGIIGTPRYMAPEQIRGEWRNQGPWTDLYSLGCLVYWLTTGKTPFAGNKVTATLVSHLQRPVPALEPRIAVPAGFDAWVATLLAKRPAERFQRSADAAWALLELGDPPDAHSDHAPLPPDLAHTMEAGELSLGEGWRLALEEDSEIRPSPLTEDAGSPRPAPVPADWRRTMPAPAPMQLVGAGLSLYGLRAVPIVGRTAERDVLWRALRSVGRTGRARAVLVRGPAGTGKSRLVEWLAERAHETGAARVMKATFSPEIPPGDALQRMGKDAMQLGGLDRDAIAARVREVMDVHGGTEDEIKVLTAMFQVETMSEMITGTGGVRFTVFSDYYTATRSGIYRLSRDRPAIVWLEDVHHGPTGLGLALQILKTQDTSPFPVLLIPTLRDEALRDDGFEAKLLGRLIDHPAATSLPVRPLERREHAQLVRGLLGLEGSLAARVEERTAGNPLFAVQLVGNWVQRGVLRVSRRGFVLKRGARADLPDDVHDVWSSHVLRVLEEFNPDAQRYLEIAAALGHQVRWAEWKRACDDPEGVFGDRFPGDDGTRAHLVDRLLSQRLAIGTRDSWSFVHAMLRESLTRTAAEQGRLAEHHRACAQMLAGQDADRVAERRGQHLLAAGAVDAAIEPLLRGVRQRQVTVGPRPAQALLSTCLGAMHDAELDERDPAWGTAWTLEARILHDLGHIEPALQRVDQALAAAQRYDWQELRLEALQTRADLALARRALPAAEEGYAALLAEARGHGAEGVGGAALLGLGEVARRRGDFLAAAGRLEEAIPTLERALSAAPTDPRADEWRVGLAHCWRLRGMSAESASEPERAGELYRRARDHYGQLGAVLGLAECDDRLARLHLEAARFDRAREGFRRALSRYEALGNPRMFACRMRLATACIRAGDPAATLRGIVEGARPTLSHLDHAGRIAASLTFRLVGAALDRDGETYDRVFAEAAAAMPRSGGAPGVIAWLGQVAGEIQLRNGDNDRAIRALQTATMIWRMSGNLALAADIERILSTREQHA